MKMYARFIAGLLSLILLASCAPADDPQDTAADTTAAVDTTTAEETLDPNLRANHFDSIPEGTKFDGASVVCLFDGDDSFITGKTANLWMYNDLLGTDSIGDPVSDAVWQRNLTTQERLDIKLTWRPSGYTSYNDNRPLFQQLLMSQDASFDFFLATGTTLSYVGMGQYMRDVKNMPHVDWESPWWWQKVNDDLSLDGKTMQFAAGDMLMTNLAMCSVTYFNKALYEDIHGNPDDLYDTTLSGKFTVDKLRELSAAAYKDVNGDGARDEGDRYGIVWTQSATSELYGMVVGCGAQTYSRGEDGMIKIDMNHERNITVVEKLTALLHDPDAVSRQNLSVRNIATAFTENKMLFSINALTYTASILRDMEADYGILPRPKLDEAQEQYFTNVPNSGTLLSVPAYISDKKFETVGATWEVLNGEAHRTYMDAFWELTMKAKYSRDAQSGKCVDLIHAGLTKDILNEYSNYNTGIIARCLVNPVVNQVDFASKYAESIEAANLKWNESIASLIGATESK